MTKPNNFFQAYIPASLDKNKPLIIVIGGSSGGLLAASIAKFFYEQGYPSAIIPYFSLEGLPCELKQIPLEYFQKQVQEIQSLESLKDRKTFIHGTSKGAEASLLLLAKGLVKIDGLILVSPSAYVWAAPADPEKLISGDEIEYSSWTYNGEDVEFVPFRSDVKYSPDVKVINNEEYFIYANTWHRKVKGNKGLINLDNIKTKILLFSGKDDALWPSLEAGEIIKKSINKSSPLVEHCVFEDVGHLIPFPGKDPKTFAVHPELGIRILYGGKEESILKASDMWWKKIQKFV